MKLLFKLILLTSFMLLSYKAVDDDNFVPSIYKIITQQEADQESELTRNYNAVFNLLVANSGDPTSTNSTIARPSTSPGTLPSIRQETDRDYLFVHLQDVYKYPGILEHLSFPSHIYLSYALRFSLKNLAGDSQWLIQSFEVVDKELKVKKRFLKANGIVFEQQISSPTA